MSDETQAQSDFYYVVVPKEIYKSKISDGALRVWICLKDQKKGFSPGIRKIAQECHMSDKKVQRKLAELVQFEFIDIVKKDRCRNKYLVKTVVTVTTDCSHNDYSTVVKTTTGCSQKDYTTINETINETSNETNNPSDTQKPTPKKKPKARQKSTPKYLPIDLEFSDSWIEWLKERGSHHAKSADRFKYATAISKLRTKFGLTNAQLPAMKKIVSTIDFWASVLVSPAGLAKPWKNGTLPINSLLDEIDKLHKKRAQPVDNFTRQLGQVVKDSIAEKERMMGNPTDNVFTIRPAQIEGGKNV